MSKGPTKDPYIDTVIDGRYRVTSRVARGGMATVYRAVDERLDREMAIKIMHTHLAEGPAGDAFIARFQREARSAARLSHAHVVGVYDQGTDGDVSYLAMELIEGDNLRSWLSRAGSLTVAETLDITEAVLLALAAADKQGLIHRDIKPENVLITHEGVVKVADFGLARAASEVSTTTTGTILGTVAYVAPEVISEGVVDQRTDLYATGIMAYEILTGEQPFVGQTPIQVAFQHVNSEVPRPSSIMESLPSEVDDLMATLTAREPADRPANAAEALVLLRRCREELSPEVLASRHTREDSSSEADSEEFPQLRGAGTDAVALESGRYTREALNAQGAAAAAHDQSDATQALGVPNAGHTMAFEIPATPGPSEPTQPPLAPAASKATPTEPGDQLQPQWIGAPRGSTPPEGAHEQRSGTLVAAGGKPPARRAKGKGSNSGRRRFTTIILPIIIVLLFAGGAVGLWWWNEHGPGAYATLPEEVEGLSVQEVERQLDSLDFVAAEVYERQYHDSIAEGDVITIDPEPGSRLLRGTEVTLTVSRGILMVGLPEEGIIGELLEDVEALLAEAGFTSDIAVETDYSDNAPRGTVLSMTPEAGEEYPHSEPISVVVSDGPAPVTIPDVEGESRGDAESRLADAGLVVTFTEEYDDDVEEGRVISQSPEAGTEGHRTDSVELVVSLGPELIEVPSIQFYAQYSDAEAQLTDLGFVVNRENVYTGSLNLVVSQSIDGGQMVPRGTTITLTVI